MHKTFHREFHLLNNCVCIFWHLKICVRDRFRHIACDLEGCKGMECYFFESVCLWLRWIILFYWCFFLPVHSLVRMLASQCLHALTSIVSCVWYGSCFFFFFHLCFGRLLQVSIFIRYACTFVALKLTKCDEK